MDSVSESLQSAYSTAKSYCLGLYAEYFYEELEGESQSSKSNSLSGGARSTVIGKIEQKNASLKQLINSIDTEAKDLNALKAQLVVLIAKKNRRKFHYPFYLMLGDNHVQNALFFLNCCWLILTIAALAVSPFHGLTSHLLWFILTFTLLGIFDVDAMVPKLLNMPQMNFTWMYMAFRLCVIDVLGITVMCLRSDYLSVQFQKHAQEWRHGGGGGGVVVQESNIQYLLVYFVLFYYWYIGRTLIMAPLKRSYPKLMVDFTLISFLWSDIFMRIRGQEGRMPWKWFWTFQLSIKEAQYTNTVSDPLFALVGSDGDDDDDDRGGKGGGSIKTGLLSETSNNNSNNNEGFGDHNQDDRYDTEVIVLGENSASSSSRDGNGSEI